MNEEQQFLFDLLKEGERAVTHEDLMKVFFWGVDYGQLLMEEERKNEEFFDAAMGYLYDKKFCMPSPPAERRHLHSDKWFEAKRKSLRSFYTFFMGEAI